MPKVEAEKEDVIKKKLFKLFKNPFPPAVRFFLMFSLFFFYSVLQQTSRQKEAGRGTR